MSEKSTKPGKAKKPRKAGQPSVLASLPATRQPRIGGERGQAAKPKPKPEATSKPKRAPSPRRRPEPATAGPRPVRSASPTLETPGDRAVAPPPAPAGAPSGTQLVTTAIQAAGELAGIGLKVGGQIVKRAVDRLPKP